MGSRRDMPSIDQLDSIVKNIASERLETLKQEIDNFSKTLLEVGDPSRINEYLVLLRDAMSSISCASDGFESLTEALKEGNETVDQMVQQDNHVKKAINTFGPYLLLYNMFASTINSDNTA